MRRSADEISQEEVIGPHGEGLIHVRGAFSITTKGLLKTNYRNATVVAMVEGQGIMR